jgi:hypothetical protein
MRMLKWNQKDIYGIHKFLYHGFLCQTRRDIRSSVSIRGNIPLVSVIHSKTVIVEEN